MSHSSDDMQFFKDGIPWRSENDSSYNEVQRYEENIQTNVGPHKDEYWQRHRIQK